MIELLFWICFLLLAYTFAGYPVLLRMLNRVFEGDRNLPDSGEHRGDDPAISIILIACDEEDRIERRLENLASCRYEGEREVVLVCDGCTDATAERARSASLEIPVRLIERDERRGKASGLNAGAAAAGGEILVFADARQRFDEEALERLVAPIRLYGNVAAVSGSLEIEPSERGAAAGIDAYWRLEKWIRREEARWDSVIGCTGAIYAMRKVDFEEIPEDTLIDDVVIPMRALVKGRRILFAPGAIAYDPQALETRHENRRKVRTLAGNYQMLFRYPRWLLPWANRCWWQLLSHKYLRLAGPLLLAVCLVTSLLLAGGSRFFLLVVAGQALCYGCALLGFLLPKVRFRLLTIPSGFLFLQWQSARAFGYYLSHRKSGGKGAWSSESGGNAP